MPLLIASAVFPSDSLSTTARHMAHWASDTVGKTNKISNMMISLAFIE